MLGVIEFQMIFEPAVPLQRDPCLEFLKIAQFHFIFKMGDASRPEKLFGVPETEFLDRPAG